MSNRENPYYREPIGYRLRLMWTKIRAAVGKRAVSGAAPVAEGEPERAALDFAEWYVETHKDPREPKSGV